MCNVKVWFLLVSLTSVVLGSPIPYGDDHDYKASEPQGRVQIKVFRGPTERDGNQKFAPWGFWVKQPSDDTQQDILPLPK